jgi:hypothetical protein
LALSPSSICCAAASLQAALAETKPANPLAPKAAHHTPKAKSVIFLFMEGGPEPHGSLRSQAAAQRTRRQADSAKLRRVITSMGEFDSPILASKRSWKQHGQGGIWVSDWLPHIAECADDLAVLRSCVADGINHSAGVCQMNTSSIIAGRPSLGSWVSYGLGTENQNLPAFVVMQDNAATVVNGPRNWGSGFMPAVYQGTRITAGSEPIPNLSTPDGVSEAEQRGKLDFLNELNRAHAASRRAQTELEARIASYELAFRMQAEAPEAGRSLEGNRRHTATLRHRRKGNRRLRPDVPPLQAPRRARRPVRPALPRRRQQVGLPRQARGESLQALPCVGQTGRRSLARSQVTRPARLHARRLGRRIRPHADERERRWPRSQPERLTMWMAGGGVKGGQTIGTTDEVGLHAVDQRLHVHDLHATILWLMGLDNMDLVYKYKGRPERPTINEGEAYRKIVG